MGDCVAELPTRDPRLGQGGVVAPNKKMQRYLGTRRGRLAQHPIIGYGTNHPGCAFKGGFAPFLDGASTPLPRRGIFFMARLYNSN